MVMCSPEGSLIKSSGGIDVSREGNWLNLHYNNAMKRLATNDATGVGLGNATRMFPLELKLSDKMVGVNLGGFIVATDITNGNAGQLELCGMSGGCAFARLSITGILDAKWAREFFAGKE